MRWSWFPSGAVTKIEHPKGAETETSTQCNATARMSTRSVLIDEAARENSLHESENGVDVFLVLCTWGVKVDIKTIIHVVAQSRAE